MARKVPQQRPGKSEQSVRTPPEFIRAVLSFLGITTFEIDLAADAENAIPSRLGYYDESMDALIYSWEDGWHWCNPPYRNIRPWVEKAKDSLHQYDSRIAMLVPASVGSNWWRDCVHGVARVYFLNGRLTFVGHTDPYPKDLALLLYAPQVVSCRRYNIWSWREDQ